MSFFLRLIKSVKSVKICKWSFGRTHNHGGKLELRNWKRLRLNSCCERFIFKIIKCIVFKWPRNGETCHYYKKPKYFEISFCWWSNPWKPMNGWRFKKFLQILHFYVSWRWPWWIWICYIYSHKGALLKLKYFIFGASLLVTLKAWTFSRICFGFLWTRKIKAFFFTLWPWLSQTKL